MQERNPGLSADVPEWHDEVVWECFCMIVPVPCGLMVELVKAGEPALQYSQDEVCPDYQQCPGLTPAGIRASLTKSQARVLSTS